MKKLLNNNLFFTSLALYRLMLIVFLLEVSFLTWAVYAANVVDEWAKFSGGKGGKIAFQREGKIQVLNLKTGSINTIADFQEFKVPGQPWQASSSYRWSPDGKKLAAQNSNILKVMNADGSNQKVIWQGNIPWDLICASWDGNNHVVYSSWDKIVKTAINNDNSKGETQTLVDTKDGDGFVSVEKNGDYVGYVDVRANVKTGGYHRAIVRKLSTNEAFELVERDEDGCTVRLKTDGSGICIFNKMRHNVPALVCEFGNKQPIYTLDMVDNKGIGGMRWANDPSFLIHNGDEEAGSTNYNTMVWIRKMPSGEAMYVDNNMHWPDLWVGDETQSNLIEQPNSYLHNEMLDKAYIVSIFDLQGKKSSSNITVAEKKLSRCKRTFRPEVVLTKYDRQQTSKLSLHIK